MRRETRARSRGTLALVLLFGFVGSVVLAAAAGARRTSTGDPGVQSFARAD